MHRPSRTGGDALIGAGVAIAGAVLALHLFSASDRPSPESVQPPVFQLPSLPSPATPETPPSPQPPILPPPQIPSLPAHQIPQFDPQKFLRWFHGGSAPASGGMDLAAMSPDEMRQAIGLRVYRAILHTPEGTGSCGSFPIASGKIATALHCVTAETIEFRTADEMQSFSGTLIWSDPANDAAVLQVQEGITLQPFPLASAQQGELVWAFGYPMVSGGRLTVTASTVLDTQSEGGDLQVPSILVPDGTYFPGNSGGPLINQRGEVVGIAHAITEIPPHIGFAVPISVLP